MTLSIKNFRLNVILGSVAQWSRSQPSVEMVCFRHDCFFFFRCYMYSFFFRFVFVFCFFIHIFPLGYYSTVHALYIEILCIWKVKRALK